MPLIAYPTTRRIRVYLELSDVEKRALVLDLLKSSLNVDISLLADTTEEKLRLAEIRMLIATSLKEGAGKLMDARVAIIVETGPRRLLGAALLVAALHLAVSSAVLADAVLVAVAGLVASDARSRVKVRSVGLGGLDDRGGHAIDGLLDGDLLVEFNEVLLGGLIHEHISGGLKRNIEGGDSISDLDRSSSSSRRGLEVLSDTEGSHLLGTILAGLTVVLDVGLDVVELILEGVARLDVDLSVVDPEEGVDISDVGVDGVIVVVGEAAGADGSSSGDVHVLRDGDVVEDRASEAGLDVEDEVLEELLVSHGLEGGVHLLGTKVATVREADSALRTVIVEENENIISGGRLEGLAAADASHVLTGEDLDEVGAGDILASVILRDAGIHIRAVRLVDDLTLLGVLSIVSDIILHHDNDVVVRDAHLVDDLISVANISLVTVVIVTVRTGSKHNPGVLLEVLLGKVRQRIGAHSNSKGKNCNKICVHLFYCC